MSNRWIKNVITNTGCPLFIDPYKIESIIMTITLISSTQCVIDFNNKQYTDCM